MAFDEFAWNKRINDLGHDLFRAYNRRSGSGAKWEFAAGLITSKALRLHRAIVLLCDAGLADEAAVLLRTLFEVRWDLMWLLSGEDGGKEELGARYCAWLAVGFVEFGVSERLKETSGASTTVLDEQLKAIQERYGLPDRPHRKWEKWHGRTTGEIAQRLGDGKWKEKMWKQLHPFVHAAPISAVPRIRMGTQGTSVSFAASPEMLQVVLLQSGALMSLVVEAYDAEFQLGCADRLRALVEEFAGTDVEAAKARAIGERK